MKIMKMKAGVKSKASMARREEKCLMREIVEKYEMK